MKVCFFTLGCKVNQYETEAMREIFINNGYSIADAFETADVIVINSCSVTAESDRKTRQLVRKCRRANSGAVIVLTGCMVQAFPEVSNSLTEADIILGNKDFSNIVCLVDKFIATKQRQFEYSKHNIGDKYITPSINDFEERTRAYMKIEDGCDRFCSYCIIPYSRGRVRSKPLNEIETEAKALADKGFCEVVLVGINLSAYGKNEDFNICDAVERISKIDGIKRIRLGSLEPDHISDGMLKRFKAVDKFCPQFHLSLQSGCDETLKRMNRKYDTAFYRDLVNRIRKIFIDPSITTDVMVGFAGETEEEFTKSLDFVKEIGFARTHIFPYSRRSGTVAAGLSSQLTTAIKTERAKKMADISKLSEKKFIKSELNKIKPVLFETPEEDFAIGYTENYIRVKVKTDCKNIGNIKNVLITECFDDYCIGKFTD